MCDVRKWIADTLNLSLQHGLKILVLGIACLLISIAIFMAAIFFNFFQSFVGIVAFLIPIGGLLTILGAWLFATKKFNEDFWGSLYSNLAIFVLIVGAMMVIFNWLDLKDIPTILTTYINIDFAILAITFAAFAIGSTEFRVWLKNDDKIKSFFKFYISLTGISLLSTVILYFLSFLHLENSFTLPPPFLKNEILIFDVMFWVVTAFTLIAIFNMLHLMSKMVDEFLDK